MTTEERVVFYQEHIKAQENSNYSIQEYCRQNRISTTQFYAWRRRIQGSLQKKSSFQKMTVVPQKHSSLVLTYPDGLKISVDNLTGSDILTFAQSLRG